MKKIVYLPLLSLMLFGCTSTEEAPNVDQITPKVGAETTMSALSQRQVATIGTLQSNPAGAYVLVNDVYVGTTPLGSVSVNQFDRIEIYKHGYEPLQFTLTTPDLPSCQFLLNSTNARIYNLLVSANARFVYRPDGLRLEPANLPVFVNSAFVAFDPAIGRDIQLNVKRITGHYVVVQTNDGVSCVYPIVRGTPANPPLVQNSQPTSSPYKATSYGTSALNPQAQVMPQVSFPATGVPAQAPTTVNANALTAYPIYGAQPAAQATYPQYIGQ